MTNEVDRIAKPRTEKLSEPKVKALLAEEKIYRVWDTEVKGLFVRVRPSGSKVFCLFYRHSGFKREYTLGRYGAITLAMARDTARRLLGDVAKGVDVHLEKKEKSKEAQKAASEMTLNEFVNGPYKDWRAAHRKRALETIHRLNSNFDGEFGRFKLKELSAWNVEKWKSEKLKSGKHASTVNRDVAYLLQIPGN